MTFTIERKAPEKKEDSEAAEPEIIEITMPPNPMRRFGFVMTMGAIAAVQEDSPAKKAGILAKDRLVKIDGEPVGRPDDPSDAAREESGGDDRRDGPARRLRGRD